MSWYNHHFAYKADDSLIGKHFQKSDYYSYYINSSSQPLYLWEDSVLASYMEYCHTNQKNCIFLPFQQSLADGIWIGSIQYVGESLAKFKSTGLYQYLQNITTFAPYWIGPYTFGELLLPISDVYRKQMSSTGEVKKSYQQAINIGQKWIYFNCDEDKINWILALSDKEFFEAVEHKNQIWQKYKNPCNNNYQLPYLHAFNYFYYLKDSSGAYKYYKISAFEEGAPPAAISMVGVVQSRLGYHQKAMRLWIDRFVSFGSKLDSWNASQTELNLKQAQEAYLKIIYEIQIILLQKASSLVSGDNKYDFAYLVSQWILKQVLEQQMNLCKPFLHQHIEFLKEKHILQLAKKVQNLASQDLFCGFFLRGVNEWYIDIQKWYLFFPLAKDDEKRIYMRDDEFWDRFPALAK